MKSTEELEHQIRSCDTPEALAGEGFALPDLAGYLRGLLEERGLTVQDVVVGCNLDRSYAYQLFNGTRRPTRNFLLRLALLLRLPEDGVQRLLKIAGRPALYARNRRDAAVLYGLTHSRTIEDVEELLNSLGEEGLT